MLSIYPAIFFHEADGSYSAVFPDLNHLSTCGDTFEEAMEMAVDALAGYLHTMAATGEEIPPATPLSEVDRHAEDDPDDEYSEADITVSAVAVDVASYAREHFGRPVKKTLAIPQWLNDIAVARRVNFSKLLRSALMQELKVAEVR